VVGGALLGGVIVSVAACRSSITYIDGDRGILQYRGYPIEQLAEHSTFLEVAYLLIHGQLPTEQKLKEWTYHITHHTFVHESIKEFMGGFHYDAHPMASSWARWVRSRPSTRTQTHSRSTLTRDPNPSSAREDATIAAFSYRHSLGWPYVYPDNEWSYVGNFLSMLFKMSELRMSTSTPA
jgi:citrate synthase